MKDLIIPPEQKESVRGICERCHRLIEVENLEASSRAFLASLGRKTWLSDLEAILLGNIEDYYLGGDGD